MNIKVNYEVAEAIIDIIENDLYKKWAIFESKMEMIKDAQGIKLMIDFYNAFDFDTYKKVLYHALNELEYDTENELIESLYEHLKRIIIHKEKLSLKLSLIKKYNYESIKNELEEKLPKETDLNIEIFFVLDGINGGSIVGNNKMMLNTMFWPSSEEHLKLIEGVLLHEYHHIGLRHWIEKYDKNFGSYSSGLEVAKYLMISIMSEGAATYFFNDGDDLYPLVVESHGEEVASAYRESMKKRGNNLQEYFSEVEKDLKYMLKFKGNTDELKTLIEKYTYNNMGEPLDKSIGYHMCAVIEDKLGLKKLIGCFENPDLFLPRYQEACNRGDELKFKDHFMNKWTEYIS